VRQHFFSPMSGSRFNGFSFNNFQTLEGFQSLAEFGRAGSIE